MFSLLFSTCLLTGTGHFVIHPGDFSLATLKKEAAVLGNRVRGRFLALFVKKGMKTSEVWSILGQSKIAFGTNNVQVDVYTHLGVTVIYKVKYFEIAGEKPEGVWIVSEVSVAPIFSLLPWPRTK